MDKMVWAGRVIRTMVTAILTADSLFGVIAPSLFRTEMAVGGLPMWTGPIIGACALTSAVLYAIPRTAVLGAIVATGFLGGAICTHLRLGDLGSPPQLVSLTIGVSAWAGLWLSDARIRALLPLRA